MPIKIVVEEGVKQPDTLNLFVELIKQNIDSNVRKRDFFYKLDADIAIVLEELSYSLTLRFQKGELKAYEGIRGIPDITIKGGYNEILQLTTLELFPLINLPKLYTPTGRELLLSLLRGKIKIYGLFSIHNLLRLYYLLQIFTIN